MQGHQNRNKIHDEPGYTLLNFVTALLLGLGSDGCQHYSCRLCVYGHTYSKSMDQPDKVANPARGQLNRENDYLSAGKYTTSSIHYNLYIWGILCDTVCVVIPFILDVGRVDAPAGVTKEEGHAGFLHLPSAALALIFIAIRIQLFLSLVDREVEFRVVTNYVVVLHLLGNLFYFYFPFICEEKSQFV